MIEIGGLRLLTDPTFSPAGIHETTPGRPLTKTEAPAVSLDDVGPIDAVLLSHDQHDDNLDPAGREALSRFPLILTTPSAAARLKGTASPLASWQSISMRRPDGGDLLITAVPARHGPEGCETVLGEVTGFVVQGPDVPTVYVSGDNASVELVRLIAGRTRDVDVALLFAGAARTSLFDGAPLTLTSSDAAIAARILDAEWVVPLHVTGWSHFSEGPEAIESAFAAAHLTGRLRLVCPGQQTTFQPGSLKVLRAPPVARSGLGPSSGSPGGRSSKFLATCSRRCSGSASDLPDCARPAPRRRARTGLRAEDR